MLLVVDSGNTNVVFALYEDRTMRGKWRASTDQRRTPDEYAVWLAQIMALQGFELKNVTAAILSNVVPAAAYGLVNFIRRYCSTEPVLAEEAWQRMGVPIRIDRPEQVGADRVVNAVGAHAKYPGPLIVADFGTATTFDIVGADGGYEGGVICPGPNTSIEALYIAAARLPRIAIERPERVIGKATVPAMQSGVFWGYVSLIEGLVQRIKQEYGQPMTVIATGGLGVLFMQATDAIDHHEPDLTLDGLVLLYEGGRG
jgi:type III pantothenate kinase